MLMLNMRMALSNGSKVPAVSTGERNTLVFQERWSVRDEVSYADVLHGQAEV